METNQMKKLILLLPCLVLLGCAYSRMEHRVAKMSTSEMQLRRYQLMYRISQPRADFNFGNTGWFHRTVLEENDLQLAEKEAIERELTRRGAIDYRSEEHVTYR
jgi:hypothetical protein